MGMIFGSETKNKDYMEQPDNKYFRIAIFFAKNRHQQSFITQEHAKIRKEQVLQKTIEEYKKKHTNTTVESYELKSVYHDTFEEEDNQIKEEDKILINVSKVDPLLTLEQRFEKTHFNQIDKIVFFHDIPYFVDKQQQGLKFQCATRYIYSCHIPIVENQTEILPCTYSKIDISPLDNAIELLKNQIVHLSTALLSSNHKNVEMVLLGSILSQNSGKGPKDIYETFLNENHTNYSEDRIIVLCHFFEDFVDVIKEALIFNDKEDKEVSTETHKHLWEMFNVLEKEIYESFPPFYQKRSSTILTLIKQTRDKIRKRNYSTMYKPWFSVLWGKSRQFLGVGVMLSLIYLCYKYLN